MFYGLDVGMVIFLIFYGAFTALCFVAAYKRYKIHLKKKQRPNLKLIQGGKKDNRHGRL